jgi:hypothetical protein
MRRRILLRSAPDVIVGFSMRKEDLLPAFDTDLFDSSFAFYFCVPIFPLISKCPSLPMMRR